MDYTATTMHASVDTCVKYTDKRASLADRGNAFTFTFSYFQLVFGHFAQLKFNNNEKSV